MREETLLERFKRYTTIMNSFFSMTRLICLSIVLFFFLAIQNKLEAQTDTITSVQKLEEIIIIGERQDGLPDIIRTTTRVTESDIESMPHYTISSLIRSLPSIDLRQRGPLDSQADISLRGGSFDQTQVLLNGVNITDPQTGHYSLNIPLDLSSISKIELLQGVSAAGGIGGALNITTKASPNNQANLILSSGQHGYLNAIGNAVINNNKSETFISASHKQSSGYIDNTDLRATNLYSFSKYRSKAGVWEAQLGYQDKSYGAYSFYSFAYPEQFDHTRMFLASLRWHKQINNLKLSALAYNRTHYNRFELFRNQAPSWYQGHNHHKTIINGGECSLEYTSLIGRTNLSIELRHEEILSNVLGHPLNKPIQYPFEGDISFTHRADRTLLRTLLYHSYQYHNLGLNAGASLHHSSDFGQRLCLAGDVSYRLKPYLIAYLAANQSLRLPSFTDLFYNSPTHEANPFLKPEEAVVYEIGTRTNKNQIGLIANLFHRRGKNIIDWVYTQGETRSKSLNHSQINAIGTELLLSYTPLNKTSYIQYLSLGYTFTNLDKEHRDKTTSYALDYLRHKLNLSVEHLVFHPKLKASWSFSLYSRSGNYIEHNTGSTLPYKPFLLSDLRLAWDASTYSLFTEINNLFNTHYFDYGGLIQPGFWLNIGVSLKME